MNTMKRTEEVFGMSNEILPDSYVDRGALDKELSRLLGRKVHIAIRGPSKSGKSWLRQRVVPNALVVQCRLGNKPLIISYFVDLRRGTRYNIEMFNSRYDH